MSRPPAASQLLRGRGEANLTRAVVGVDVGGTFTDFVLLEAGDVRTFKALSTPADPSSAVLAGLRAMSAPADADVAHGTTVATNALLERKGARTALLVTEGFEDLLEIGRQTRPALYDLLVERPTPLVPSELRIGVPERVDREGMAIVDLSPEAARRLAASVRDRGAEAVAVSLLFSFLNPTHESLLKEALSAADRGLFLSVSSDLVPEYREYERTSTTVVNAYVGPVVATYLRHLRDAVGRRLRVMHSGGGSLSAEGAAAEPVRTLLSGPAGGAAGAFHLASRSGHPNVITFDMGGTSTDVSLCPGRLQETGSTRVGGYPVTVPMIDIHTVGAGGGSIARRDAGGALVVGPQSAGAEPGPACYGRGDVPTVTDANLLLGRMDPARFLGGRMALDADRAHAALDRLGRALGLDPTATAEGVLRVANATMERALRTISLERGFDPRRFTLVAFGGAGPMHACALAQALGMPRVLVPPYSGVLSALGVAMADVTKDYSRALLLPEERVTEDALRTAFAHMESQAIEDMAEEGFPGSPGARVSLSRRLDMRYRGQSYELAVDCPRLGEGVGRAAARRFHRAHRQRFGYSDASHPTEVVTLRLKAVGATEKPAFPTLPLATDDPRDALVDERPAIFEGRSWPTACYDRDRLRHGHRLRGPALVFQMDATTVVPPGWQAWVDAHGNLAMEASGE